MVCPKCGSPVSGGDETCTNCGAELERKVDDLEDKSEGLREMTQRLKAVEESRQRFPSGETIADRFEIDEFVEAGPFGEVYRAHDEIIETDVALKIYEEDVVRTPPEREGFLDATRAARAMTQKNVVRVHDSGVHEDHPWVSMQYLEGLSLEKALNLREKKGERFTLDELEPVVTQITLALQHIGREFPNGDLKPTNVFFLPDLLKVTDGYTLSALPGEVFTERLEDSKYVAPELYTSVDNADVRCDVYSLGTIIGEMYFGPDYVPGEKAVTEPEETAVDVLCQRATAFDPAERYPTVEALSEDFSTLVDTGQLLDRGSALSPSSDVPTDEGPVAGESGPKPPPGAPNAEFPEEEVATRDYERSDPGPGPAGPTNEVDRENYPPPNARKPGELPPEPEAPAPPPSERPAAEGAQATGRPEEAAAGGQKKKKKDASDDEGADPVAIGGVVVALAVLAGLIVWLVPDDVNREEVVDISDETKEKSAVAAKGSGDAGPGTTDGGGPDAKVLATTIQAVMSANHSALEAARSKAESAEADGDDEEEKEESDEESSTAVATKGGRAGTPSSEQTGSAATRSGGREEEVDKPKPARGTDCPDGMALVERDSGNYCIDRYEYPGPGQKPATNVTWFQAKAKCKAEGKRLCTRVEFGRACGSKYPWGDEWDATKCNTQDPSGFARSVAPAGEFKECRSWPGTYDMVGNVLEWVKEQQIVGGAFDSGKEVASCQYASAKAPGSSAPTVGFRCCTQPD